MSDIKLFRTSNGTVEELKGTSVAVEKSLQTLIEQHLETFLGIRFLASEHNTGKVHGGRIDTLGIDENGYPVIIEYKRALNENVINQGLFYLDWLMDHKADFKLLVMERLGKEIADTIEWNSPRLLCIARDFTNYDEHAVKQIPRNIELLRYRRYSDDFLMLELVNAVTSTKGPIPPSVSGPLSPDPIGHLSVLQQAPDDMRDLFESLKAFLFALGDDVQMKSLKNYVAFKRMRNFAAAAIHPKAGIIHVWAGRASDDTPVDPTFIRIESNNVIRLMLRSQGDLLRAQPFLISSYEGG
jgi:predicted transport protein